MKLIMAGIDYKTAELQIREKFSLSTTKTKEVLQELKCVKGVEGAVLVSTCNRTEVYLSVAESFDENIVTIFLQVLAFDNKNYQKYFTIRKDRTLVKHLMMVTAGLRSQLRGDDQIITQVNQGISIARSVGSMDSILENLFRNAVTSGKKIKTSVPFYSVERSVAKLGIEALERTAESLKNKKALVIGNGTMGRLTAKLLVEKGCWVTVTLRSYKRGETIIPEGCDSIAYDNRYQIIPSCQILVSATTSTHHTITQKALSECERLPSYILDLAVPQDIQSTVWDISGIKCWNVDQLTQPEERLDIEKISKASEIMKKYEAKFYHWNDYRLMLKTNKRGAI